MKVKELLWFLFSALALGGLYYSLCQTAGVEMLSPSLEFRIGEHSFTAGAAMIIGFHFVAGFFLIYLMRALFGLFANNTVNTILLISSALMAAWFAYLIYLANAHGLMGLKVGDPQLLSEATGVLNLPVGGEQGRYVLKYLLYGKLGFFVLLLFFTIYRTGANDARPKVAQSAS